MKIVFISSGQYPNGGAATNRVLAYSKGLYELGNEINFLLLENQAWNNDEYYEYDNIKFNCVYPYKNKPDSKVKKAKAFIKSISNAKNKLIKLNRENIVDAIIILDVNPITIFTLLRFSKKLKIKTFHERTEYPFVIGNKTIIDKLKNRIYLNFLIQNFDGIYVINKALKKYFMHKTNHKVPIQIVNMVVDPSRFEKNAKNITDSFVISYCGSLEGEKDGVSILIEAFSILVREFPDIKLQIIGSLKNNETRENITRIINKFSLKDNIELTGQVQRDEIPNLLCKANILALARPNNKQAEGGFPTKLGEYLATGNVVVVTNVGEISDFLIDSVNAFISEPDDAQKFALKLKEAIISDHKISIGAEGKKLVSREFNYLTQAEVLAKWVKSFI